MPDVHYRSEEIHNASGSIAGVSDEILDRINLMNSVVTNLIANDWRAGSGNAFQGVFSEWKQAANQMEIALRQLGAAAGKAATIVEETEVAITIHKG